MKAETQVRTWPIARCQIFAPWVFLLRNRSYTETVWRNGTSLIFLASCVRVSWPRRSCKHGFSVPNLVGNCFSQTKGKHLCPDITLANTGRLSQLLPLKLLSGLCRINLSGTSISSQHFLQLVSTARRLWELNIQYCVKIGEKGIFKAKLSLPLLRRINISQNGQFTILAIACLCSIDALEEITARGISLEYKEILFLSNTFPQLRNGLDLETDTTDGDYFFDAVDIVSDLDDLDDLF